jgi:hypothetical protein
MNKGDGLLFRMTGIELMHHVIEMRDPHAKTFASAKVVDSSFIQELHENGFIDAVWKKLPAANEQTCGARGQRWSPTAKAGA